MNLPFKLAGLDFTPFPKMPRLSREIFITEKIDGTNASIHIEEATDSFTISRGEDDDTVVSVLHLPDRKLFMRVGSRNRWIMPNDNERDENGRKVDLDNYGFAEWARDNAHELFKLGPGHHFGEWWGHGIARKYGLSERRFSLFNAGRWSDDAVRPACCHVVPILYRGNFTTEAVEQALDELVNNGSAAAPGFMNPEGVIIYHVAAGVSFKKTIHKDDLPKALAKEAA